MSSPFQFAIGALLNTLHSVTASPAVYRGTRNGTAKSLELDVSWGAGGIEELIQEVSGTVLDFRDALIRNHAALFTRFGEPQRGDTIEQDGITRKVLPITDSGALFEWSDASRQVLRVHTQVIAE